MASNRYRYPGVKPFTEEDRDLFFGREDDIRRFQQLVILESLVVLFGRSGLGKSSLLDAGIIPLFREGVQGGQKIRFKEWRSDIAFEVRKIRLFNYNKDHPLSPVDRTIQVLSDISKTSELENFFSAITPSIWKAAKQFQLSHQNKKALLLFFDQFEELFSYPPEDVKRFSENLAKLLSNNLPEEAQRTLNKLMEEEHEVQDEQMELLLTPLPVKVVMAIRSDKFSLLKRMSEFLPGIISSTYELQPLSPQQAKDAITKPAGKKDDFKTLPFEFEPDAIEKILDMLMRRTEDLYEENETGIDSTYLQIVCEHAEREIVEARKDVKISADDLGRMELILQNFYVKQLKELEVSETASDLRKIQNLLEERLIKNERRYAQSRKEILDELQMESRLFDVLIDRRLIRSEQLSSGIYYELSHDSLVQPILKVRQERITTEERLSATANEIQQQSDQLNEAPGKDKREEESDETYISLGLSLSLSGQNAEAIKQYTKALELNPDRALTYRNRGIVYQSMNETENAIHDFEKAIELNPKYADALNDLGVLYLNIKEYKKAITYLNMAINADPQYIYSYNNLGVCYEKLVPEEKATDEKSYQEAIDSYSKCMEIDPFYATAIKNRGLLYYKLGEYQKCIDDLERYLLLKVTDSEAINEIGRSYYQLSFSEKISVDERKANAEKALEYFERVSQIEPNGPYALNNCGAALKQLGRLEEALEMYSKAIGFDPDYESAIRNRGLVFKKLDRRAEAILDFRKALSVKASEENFYNLILFLCEDGNSEEAEELMNTAFNSFPDYDKYVYPYVSEIRDSKQYDVALALVEMLIAKKPKEEDYILSKGNIYFYQKKYAEAKACYEQVIKLNENYSMGYNNLAAIEQRSGNMQDSIPLLDKAIELDPNNELAFSNRAYANIKLGEFSSARDDLETSLKMNPSNGDAFAYKGFIELLQNKDEEKFFSLLENSVNQSEPYQLQDEIEDEAILQPYKNDLRMKTLLYKVEIKYGIFKGVSFAEDKKRLS